MSFSERQGLKAKKSMLQIDSMDDALRNSLWNALFEHYFSTNLQKSKLIKVLWIDYFKRPIDQIKGWNWFRQYIRGYFYQAEWNEAYDFIEFIPSAQYSSQNKPFRQLCNTFLERELSAYRFVGNLITRITNEIEMNAVEEAIESEFANANQHLQSALRLFSDRQSPNYRKSIQESISAVEAVCRELTGESTLDKALKKISNKIHINDQLKSGWEKIYHYTNGEDGIRHALMTESDSVGSEEAKFMLVSCSAFVNFLAGKNAGSANISLL